MSINRCSEPGECCPPGEGDGVDVNALIEWMRGRGRVLIITHDNPDPDSIAAAVGLRHLILLKTGQNSVLAYGGVIGRGENRQMVELLEISMVPISELELDQFNVVCMVDTQPGSGNNSWPDDRRVHLVIDHHGFKSSLENVCWVDVREHYGASATILYEYLIDQKVTLNTKLATSLFYAIKSETQDLGREWSRADREAYLKLLPLSNNRILFDILHPEVPRDYFCAFNRAIESSVIYGEVLVFNLKSTGNPDHVAELADFLLRQQGVRYVLGMGWFEGTQILSMRTLNSDARLGQVIQDMVRGFGSAGGHGMVAGGQIRNVGGDDQAQDALQQTLTHRLLDSLRVPRSVGEPLIVPPAD